MTTTTESAAAPGPPGTTGSTGDGKRYITESALLEDSFRLGVKVANSGFRPGMIVGLWRGGSTVGIYVQESLQYLGIHTDHIAVRTSYRGLSSYQRMVDDPEREIRVHGTRYLLETLSHDSGLLIVDDVHSSGQTTAAVVDRLASRLKLNMPKDVRTAAVWSKPARNRTGRQPDYHVHETDDWLVMPYELNGLSRSDIESGKPWILPILDSLDANSAESGRVDEAGDTGVPDDNGAKA